MTESTLTYPDRLLLQRLHDADVTLEAQERAKAEQLVASHELARQFVEGLKELNTATKAAEGEAWSLAPERTAATMAQAAQEALALEQWPLEHLMPMLERIHDGEADEADLVGFERLLEAREDVADYMAVLDESRHGVIFSHEQALEQVSFDQLWSGINARLDDTDSTAVATLDAAPTQAQVVSFPRQPATAERLSFDLKEHQLMLARFFDGEAEAKESAQVQAWLEIDPSAATTLAVMEELSLAVQGAVDELQERAPLAQIWSGVEAVIDAEREGKVVSFEQARDRQAQPRSIWATLPKRELIAAAAAALFTVAGIGMFADKIFNKEPVIVERTVVIVDSVEYSSGSSGMVVQPASMGLNGASTLSSAPPQAGSAAQDSQEEASPTIIWLLDDDAAQPAPAPEESETSPTLSPDQGQPI